jgi:hypothetical protein
MLSATVTAQIAATPLELSGKRIARNAWQKHDDFERSDPWNAVRQ